MKVIFNLIPSHVDIKENGRFIGKKNACKNELIEVQVPTK